MRFDARPAAPSPAQHGEGPVWDGERNELLWVDIPAGQVRRATVDSDGERTDVTEVAVSRVEGTVGFVVPAAAGGWLLGAGAGFTHLDEDGGSRVLISLTGEGGDPDTGGTRMNDGGCDRTGRFFAGTMAFDKRPGAGSLYRLDLDGTTTVVRAGLTISNGMGWSPDDRTVYLADSGPGLVYAFDYDLASGELSAERVLLEFPGDTGVADGLTVDDQGCLWTAMWGAGQVRRWSPEGELLAVVHVEVQNTSSCAFSGPDRDVLVISTSQEGLSPEQLAAHPDAGRLFTARPGASAPPAFPYRGRLSGLSQA